MKALPGYEYPLHLTLDARVSLEAMLIQRLRQQPKSRHQEWLRRLLVLGFTEECRSLRSGAGKTERPTAGTAAIQWHTQDSKKAEASQFAPRQTQATVVAVAQKPRKPLAALQKVLGDKVA